MIAYCVKDGAIVNSIVVDTLEEIQGYDAVFDIESKYDFASYGNFELYFPPESPNEAVESNKTTARQIRLALLQMGVTGTDVGTMLSALPYPQNEEALVEWRYGMEYERNHILMPILKDVLNITDEQIDGLWSLAQSL